MNLPKKNKNRWIATYCLVLHFSCSTLSINNPHSGTTLVIDTSKARCAPAKTFHQWYALYGIIPISKRNPENLFPTTESSYRITEKVSWADAVISFVGGIALSITRKSLLIEKCEKTIQTISKDRFNAELKLEQEKLTRSCDNRLEEDRTSFSRKLETQIKQESERQIQSCTQKLQLLEKDMKAECSSKAASNQESSRSIKQESQAERE